MNENIALVARRLRPRYDELVIGTEPRTRNSSEKSAVLMGALPDRVIDHCKGVSPDVELVFVVHERPTDALIDPLVDVSMETGRAVRSIERMRYVSHESDPWVLTFGPVDRPSDRARAFESVSRLLMRTLASENRRLEDERFIAAEEWSSIRDLQVETVMELEVARSLRATTSFRLGHLLVSIARAPHRVIAILRAARSTAADENRVIKPGRRPDRSTSKRHLDHDLLWRWRRFPDPPFFAMIGRRSLTVGRSPAILLSPHDASGILANSAPCALVIESAAGEIGEVWSGLGTSARPHLETEVWRCVSIAQRSGVPVVAWQSRATIAGDWFDSLVPEADIVLADAKTGAPTAHADLHVDAAPHAILETILELLPARRDQ